MFFNDMFILGHWTNLHLFWWYGALVPKWCHWKRCHGRPSHKVVSQTKNFCQIISTGVARNQFLATSVQIFECAGCSHDARGSGALNLGVKVVLGRAGSSESLNKTKRVYTCNFSRYVKIRIHVHPCNFTGFEHNDTCVYKQFQLYVKIRVFACDPSLVLGDTVGDLLLLEEWSRVIQIYCFLVDRFS